MASIDQINSFLKNMLDPKTVQDLAINGIQVGTEQQIDTILFGVDASMPLIEEAVRSGSQIMITHHGFFWGKPFPIEHHMKKRLKMMLQHDIGLISYHLPLDCHPEAGNNIQILKTLGAVNPKPFGYYRNFPIGFQGEFESPRSIDTIIRDLGVKDYHYLDGGNRDIRTVAVVSGGGTSCFDEALENQVDLFITGDQSHQLYHSAYENHINLLFAGHYFTETFGVKALMPIIEKEFGVKTHFIDIPTRL